MLIQLTKQHKLRVGQYLPAVFVNASTVHKSYFDVSLDTRHWLAEIHSKIAFAKFNNIRNRFLKADGVLIIFFLKKNRCLKKQMKMLNYMQENLYQKTDVVYGSGAVRSSFFFVIPWELFRV